MTPQQLDEFNALKKLVESLSRVENVAFIENLARRLEITLNVPRRLDDLSDVTAPSPSVGQVLEWNGTAWVNALDNI